MPENTENSQETMERAQQDLREGKRPSTAAGEFVHEEIEHVRKGKHGARSTKQAIAMGLSKARRAGVPLKPPGKGKAGEKTRSSAEKAYETGQGKRSPKAPSAKRSAAVSEHMKREPRGAASKKALSAQAKQAAAKRKRRR